MKLVRRNFIHLAAGYAALSTMPRIAMALDYPSRPVRLLVGYAAGGVNDIIARLTGQILSERLGKPFVIENRPGAGSNLATEALVRAQPDGYTLLEGSGSNSWNAALYDRLNFDFIRDTVPVASTVRTYNVMEVSPSVPANTVAEFIGYAKANPGKINMASAGQGSSPHLYGELFKKMAGVDLVTVHYRGSGPALPDLMGGQCQVMFNPVVSSIEHIRAGKLRALAVTSATRVALLPDLPTVGETVPGYVATSWQGIVAPKNTPTEIIERLNTEINAGLSDPNFRQRLANLGVQAVPGSPSEFAKFIVDYTEKWAKVIREAGIKAE
jgi:tripartite-type tricarboxylate transporter receptor subunit TctC